VEALRNPAPLIVRVWATAPKAKDAGESEVIVGTGLVGGAVTVTLAEPDFVKSCVEVAVMLAVPMLVGVKTPALVTVPPVAVQVTVEL
jgi:uncharacterized membrane protein